MGDQFNKWCRSLANSLGSLEFDYDPRSRSIFLVPERLKKPNEDAYMPKVVLIGPRFKGSKEDLLLMEDIKIRCMMHLFRRRKQRKQVRIRRDASSNQKITDETYEKLESCFKELQEIDNVIRASYVPNVNNIETQELTQIMLVDGCFLLELLIAKGLDDKLPEPELDNFIFPSPAIQLIRDEDVLSDLTLLENQIPIRVIYLLFRTLFADLTGYSNSDDGETRIISLILLVFGYHQFMDHDIRSNHIQGNHILDIVNSFVNGNFVVEEYVDHVIVTFTERIDRMETTEQHQHQLKMNRCALRLLTAGVIIKKYERYSNFNFSCLSLVGSFLSVLIERILVNGRGKHLDLDYIHQEAGLKGLDFHFKFQNGKLEIKQLHITRTTKAKWCNLIAWEHLLSNLQTRGDSGNCKFTSAALMFNGLICSKDDVQLLKDKKIVVDHLKMSNQELMEYFRKVALGVDHKVVASSRYTQMVGDINNYSKAFFIKRIWIMLWNSFTYRQEWVVRFLNRNYNFVATVVFVLTVVQTVYAILAYYFPK